MRLKTNISTYSQQASNLRPIRIGCADVSPLGYVCLDLKNPPKIPLPHLCIAQRQVPCRPDAAPTVSTWNIGAAAAAVAAPAIPLLLVEGPAAGVLAHRLGKLESKKTSEIIRLDLLINIHIIMVCNANKQ